MTDKKKINFDKKQVLDNILKTLKVVLVKIKDTSLLLLRKINITNIKLGKLNIKIASEGKNTILAILAITIVLLFILGIGFITTSLIFFLLLTLYFFRDPERVLPDKKNVVVSPCDGKVLKVETSSLPEELGGKDTKEYLKISVCMDITDMHIQRIPVDCRVKQIEYVKGTFINATLDKSSKDNERNILLLERENGDNICVVQIAGLIARRIVCNVEKDEQCNAGEKYGMIKFGSRVEVYLPKNYKVEVLAGQTVICGETILASFER